MEVYSDFAGVYDTFMDETPYEEWSGFFDELIKKYGISEKRAQTGAKEKEAENENPAILLQSERNLVLDLGCGTGTLTEMMAAKGYDMIGVDNSQEMLSIAMEKKEKNSSSTLYLLQDMRELELYSTVGTVLSVCDCVNYLLEEDDLLETFRLVNNYLYPGGIFIFDFNTGYKYEQVIGDATIAERREDCSFIWENYYDPEGQINEYDLTLFVQEGEDENGPVFRRFQENHFQRGYTLEQMTRLVEKAGLKVELTLDADSHGAPTAESERIYILAREVEKDVKRF